MLAYCELSSPGIKGLFRPVLAAIANRTRKLVTPISPYRTAGYLSRRISWGTDHRPPTRDRESHTERSGARSCMRGAYRGVGSRVCDMVGFCPASYRFGNQSRSL